MCESRFAVFSIARPRAIQPRQRPGRDGAIVSAISRADERQVKRFNCHLRTRMKQSKDRPVMLVCGTPLHFLAEENCSARPSSIWNTVSTP